MAVDATGTPTSPDGIPELNTAVDGPTGKGMNAMMDSVQTALNTKVSKPASIVAGEVPVWNGTTWVRSSVTNVGPTSLGSGTPDNTKFLRGDGTWTVAPTITTSTIASGPPGSPKDGDIWVATAVDANGTRWAFQYNAGSASAYKWEFVGGNAAHITAGSLITSTLPGTWQNLSGGGSFTIARGGDYVFKFGALILQGGTFGSAYTGYTRLNQSAVGLIGYDARVVFTATNTGGSVASYAVQLAIPAAAVITQMVMIDSAQATNFQSVWFDVTPARIS